MVKLHKSYYLMHIFFLFIVIFISLFQNNLPFTYKDISLFYCILKLRLIWLIESFFTGMALSICGVVLQTILYNPLASPYTIGVSGMASLGAMIFFYLSSHLFLKIPLISMSTGAFIFSICTIFFLLNISKKFDYQALIKFILIGVVLNIMSSSIILFLKYLLSPTEALTIDRWLIGNISATEIKSLLPLIIVSTISLIFFLKNSTKLDILTFGVEVAKSRGIDVEKFLKILIIFCSLVLSISISTSGIISFVGLIIPHIVKLIGYHNHKNLLFLSGIYGGIFLVICDIISRIIINGVVIPIGIITSTIGGIVFLYLILKNK